WDVVVQGDGLVEVTVLEDVEDGGEGFVAHDVGLAGDFHKGGTDVEGFGRCIDINTFAAGDGGAFVASGVQSGLHRVEGAGVDERTDEGVGLARVADGDGTIDLPEAWDQLVVDGVVDDEAAEGGATLAGGAHGGEGDAAESEVEIRRRSDDGGVVAAELEDGAAEAFGETGANGTAHGCRAGGGDERDEGRVDEELDECGEVGWRGAELLACAFKDSLRGERGERCLLGGLPDDGVAADEGERGVPAPDGDGEVERGDDADDAEWVPGLHHAMVGALGRDGEAGELAREAGRE